MPTQKKRKTSPDDLRPEYDLSTLGKGVRGKYYRQAAAGSNIVVLDPDVARTFRTSASVGPGRLEAYLSGRPPKR